MDGRLFIEAHPVDIQSSGKDENGVTHYTVSISISTNFRRRDLVKFLWKMWWTL